MKILPTTSLSNMNSTKIEEERERTKIETSRLLLRLRFEREMEMEKEGNSKRRWVGKGLEVYIIGLLVATLASRFGLGPGPTWFISLISKHVIETTK